jgi:hypothetical protein
VKKALCFAHVKALNDEENRSYNILRELAIQPIGCGR